MKRSKIIIFSVALAFLLFANLKITLFDGTDDEINIHLNNSEIFAFGPGNDDQLHDSGIGPGMGDIDGCYESYTLDCLLGNQQKICDFTGVYGPPYYCTQVDCSNNQSRRKCERK